MLKLPKFQKILKNQKLHYLEIIETKQNVYITPQQKNIRNIWVTLKKIHSYTCRNFPNDFKYYKKNESKNTYVKTSKRQKELKIKKFKAYKLQKQNKNKNKNM